MAIVYSVLNLKGGIGKSVITWNLAHGLKEKNKRVLIIDMDSQGDTSWIAGAETKLTAYDVITGKCNIKDAIQEINGISIISADSNLSKLDSELREKGKESALFEKLVDIADQYDVIITDNTPKTSITSILSLYSSDRVIVPLVPHAISLKACMDTIETVQLLQEYNPDLKISGFVFNMYQARLTLSKEVDSILDEIAKENNIKIYDTRIRNSVSIAESMGMHLSIFDYAATSNLGYVDFMQFVDEVAKEIEENE